MFPLAEPFTKAELRDQGERSASEEADLEKGLSSIRDSEEALAECFAECTKALEAEEERRQSVDSRLTSVIGLFSIAGTVVFGILLAEASGGVEIRPLWFRYFMVFGALYLTLQLSSAILAGVRGLERRKYLLRRTQDMVPAKSKTVHLRNRVNEQFRLLADQRSQNDSKVTQMAVAHRAMKNFIGGLLVIAFCATLADVIPARKSGPPGKGVKEARVSVPSHQVVASHGLKSGSHSILVPTTGKESKTSKK